MGVFKNEFIKDYPVNKLKSADYNPRKINEEGFEALKYSLNKFGVIKPLILNGKNKVLTAGHQRTKASKKIGLKEVPVIVINTDIPLSDEICFNLLHNSVETEKSKVKVLADKDINLGYTLLEDYKLEIKERGKADVVNQISKTIAKYGAWGSIVINEENEIIQNSEYAIACELMKEPLIIYKLENKYCKEYIDICNNNEFGQYYYEKLGIKAYNQIYCQMRREIERGHCRSLLYEERVMKEITKESRIVDFGCGRGAYVKFLENKGYKIKGYEPHFKAENSMNINVREVVKMINSLRLDIRKKGLYDVVILDSVLNSITSLEFEDYVMTSCNALLSKEGTFYCSTRDISQIGHTGESITFSRKNRIKYLDKNNFAINFRDGAWTLQKFNSKESLKELLSKYFEEVEVKRYDEALHGIGKKPKRFNSERYRKALDIEFNMEYPNNYRHNRHFDLVENIIEQLEEENNNHIQNEK